MRYLQQLTDHPSYDLHWQMTSCERFALQGLLKSLKSELSIEIGTYRGGSLQVLSQYSNKVISIDIDPEISHRLNNKFTNVDFLVGDSIKILPELVEKLNHEQAPVGFILIDGDHSTEGVRRDIEFILNLKPQKRIVILMHDSFNPTCREGMRTAAWHLSPHVAWVELDFIPGIYHEKSHDTAEARTMWGGFGCAIMEPYARTEALIIHESQVGLYSATYAKSAHAQKNTLRSRINGLVKSATNKFK